MLSSSHLVGPVTAALECKVIAPTEKQLKFAIVIAIAKDSLPIVFSRLDAVDRGLGAAWDVAVARAEPRLTAERGRLS